MTHAGNIDKWEARRTLEFITAFLGIVVCPREDKKIEIGLVGMADVAIKRANNNIVPLILLEMYQALITSKEQGGFFQGCNLLLHLWMQEHLYHRAGCITYGLNGLNVIEKFEKRAICVAFSEGTKDWFV